MRGSRGDTNQDLPDTALAPQVLYKIVSVTLALSCTKCSPLASRHTVTPREGGTRLWLPRSAGAPGRCCRWGRTARGPPLRGRSRGGASPCRSPPLADAAQGLVHDRVGVAVVPCDAGLHQVLHIGPGQPRRVPSRRGCRAVQAVRTSSHGPGRPLLRGGRGRGLSCGWFSRPGAEGEAWSTGPTGRPAGRRQRAPSCGQHRRHQPGPAPRSSRLRVRPGCAPHERGGSGWFGG